MITQLHDHPIDNQYRVNLASDPMQVHWEKMSDIDIDSYHRGITSSDTSLTVITLPGIAVCRKYCKESLLTRYCVWHPFFKLEI